ncbi:hypothetical protein FS749_009274 [Ceratobasidium sp. UAMH 11750]|nr:hypothetical protein FS749_009274 [Ceratobasidium sp. UAMH 11750]
MLPDEIRDDLDSICGVQVCPTTISNTLKRHGITRKKVDTRAMERNETRRAEFWQIVRQLYNSQQLVCVDESSIDLPNTERSHGYAPSGQKASRKVLFDRGQ